MFYDAEEVQVAVDSAIELFGPVGNMLESSTWKDFCVMTKQYGKLWYGDINCSPVEVTQKCQMLAHKLGQKVYILPDADFTQTDGMLEFSN
jgi:hypothetical protein